jgi:hypothetical protein
MFRTLITSAAIAIALIFVLLFFLFSGPASAAPNCATNEQVRDILVGKYGEELMSVGFDADGQAVATWGNIETGSWTITVTSGDTTCVVAQGGLFQRMASAPNV